MTDTREDWINTITVALQELEKDDWLNDKRIKNIWVEIRKLQRELGLI
jgi:hypothetical protein